MEEKVYSVKDVAEVMDVNEETVRRWIRSGRLKCSRNRGRGGNKIMESNLIDFKDDKYTAMLGWREKLGINHDAVPEVDEIVEDESIDERISELERAIGLLSAELEYWKRIKIVLEGP